MSKNSEDLHKVCDILDKLTLDALTLMQEEIDLKINAENAMIGGESHLAKTRYILGQNSVTSLQLPTENSPEFDALTVVHTNDDDYSVKRFDLESHKPDNEHFLNPVKWFGFMPPQNLHFAQNLYRQALQWLIQAANVQNRLRETQEQIGMLKKYKEESNCQQIPCVESGRFYRNPSPASTEPEFLWSTDECSKYHLCLEGEVFNFKCSSGLVFDIDKQTCESIEKVFNCDKVTESALTRLSAETVTDPNICENPNHQKCRDGTCISKEYFCDGAIDCPDGSDEGQCDPNRDLRAESYCDPSRCHLPACFCSRNGTSIPGNIPPSEVPQMVIITFDDSINDDNIDFYSSIFSKKYVNPNNCPIAATFFVTHQYNNYYFTQKLWNQGHEIAVHSVTHRQPEKWWSNNATMEDWFDEMVGQANIINRFSNVRLSDIRGLRVPFLRIGWNRQYLMMKEFGFQYDSSIVAPYSYVPLWPYTLDFRMPHKCFRQMCPTRSYPGLWEMVINQLEAMDISCATLDSCPSELSGQEIYQTLMRNFNRHYSTNKAPFGIHLQASWFENSEYFAAFQEFLDYVLSKPDVWFVTNSQAIAWMQQPTPLKKLLKFKPWNCRRNFKRPHEMACDNPNMCHLMSRALKEDVELQTCSPCPMRYPWVKNEFGIEVRV